ncbi:uncharacterized protein LOC135219074 [Macrobrachium nipponense]|uniref:uncharacterized protein LOC135219074 n=1 Tax=Macrobrachium nipponense TaxID=159736 RepID=UPI0030C812F8
MDILCQILGLLFLMVLQAESMSLGWDEESLTEGGHDVDWVGYGSNLGAPSVDQPWSEDNWRDTWYNDNEAVLLEPGETATFSFTFGNQEASKYVEYKISSVRTLSSYSSLVFTCDMKSLWNSSDCSSGKVTIGYGQKTLRLCSEAHSVKDEQAEDFLRILAENILPSYGNIHCRIYANCDGSSNSPVLLHTVMTTMTNVMCKKMFSPTFFIPDEEICARASGKSQGLSR